MTSRTGRVALIVAALLLCLAPAAWAAGGMVQGQVVNGTAGATSTLENLPVRLYLVQGDTLKETRQAKTDAKGMFRFEGVPTGSGGSALVEVDYAGVEYASKMLDLSAGTAFDADITVYETTTDDSAIAIERSHLLIEMQGGQLGVTEMVVLVNKGNRTFAGGGEDVVPNRKATVEIPLPAGATDASFNSQEAAQAMLRTGKGFVDTRPIIPGQSMYAFSYVLPYEGSTYSLLKPVAYATANLDVFIAASGAEISAPALESLGTSEASGRSYVRLRGASLAAGADVIIRFSGLGQAAAGQPGASGSTSAPAYALGRPIWYNAALGSLPFLALLALMAALVFGLLRTGPARWLPSAGDAASAVDVEYQRALASIADLDERYEASELAEAAYYKQRQAEKELLLDLMRSGLQGGEGDTEKASRARAARSAAGGGSGKKVRASGRPAPRRPKTG